MAFWNWDPNDRDLQDFKFWLNHKIQPDIQLTQEIRYAGQVSSKLSGVVVPFYRSNG
jgi:iron complex outermembrane receptor protein